MALSSRAWAGYVNGETNDVLDPAFNASNYATQVISATGSIGQSTSDTLYNSPTAVLGAPNLWFYDGLGGFTDDRTKIVEAPYYKTSDNDTAGGNPLITQLNNKGLGGKTAAPGTIEVKMGSPVYADPVHPYGIDFIVYGNSFFTGSGGSTINDSTNLNTLGINGLYSHITSVSVSPDGVNWYTYPDTQALLPYNGYLWNSSSASWSSQPADQLKAVNPGVYSLLPGVTTNTSSGAAGTAAQATSLYDGASGGTGFSLAGTGFSSIQYIRVTPGNQATIPNSTYTVINAFAAARSMAVGDQLSIAPDNITAGTNTLCFQDPDNSAQTFIAANFTAVSDAAAFSTAFVTNSNELSSLPGTALETYQLGASDLLGNSGLTYSASLNLFAGYSYTGNGSNLAVYDWTGSAWQPQAFTFNTSTGMVTVTGVSNLSAMAITQISGSSSLTWTNSAGTGVWIVNGDANWNLPGVAYTNGSNVVFDNSVTTSNQTVTIKGTVSPVSITVSNSTGNYIFSGTGSIAGSTGLTKNGSARLTVATVNSYTGATTVNGGTLELAVAGALPSGNALTIAGGAQVIADSNTGLLVLNSLNLDPANTGTAAGKIDLTNNGMVIQSGTLATIAGYLKAGSNNLAWNGATGITSSTAAADTSHLTTLGMIQNTGSSGSAIYTTAFDGATGLNLTTSDVLVRYTYYGDANLDGHVDGSDYTLIDNGFAHHLTGWLNGDFNYDGVVDGSDYTLIDNAFNGQGSPLAGGSAAIAAQFSTSVPEPFSGGVIAAGVALFSIRRRRHKRSW